jgi:hypothetical protein
MKFIIINWNLVKVMIKLSLVSGFIQNNIKIYPTMLKKQFSFQKLKQNIAFFIIR